MDVGLILLISHDEFGGRWSLLEVVTVIEVEDLERNLACLYTLEIRLEDLNMPVLLSEMLLKDCVSYFLTSIFLCS